MPQSSDRPTPRRSPSITAPASRRFTPMLEDCPKRVLLTVTNAAIPGAVLVRDVNWGETNTWTFSAKDFPTLFGQARSGNTILTILCENAPNTDPAQTPNPVNPDPVTVKPLNGPPRNARPIAVRTDLSATDPSSLCIMAARSGSWTIRASGTDSATGDPATANNGSFARIVVSLTGDVNGDRQVTFQDLQLVQNAWRAARWGAQTVNTAADVDHDGRNTWTDIQLTRANLGIASTLNASSQTLKSALTTASDPNANGIILNNRVTLTGRAAPGATVRVIRSGAADNTAVTAKADARGSYQINVSIPRGESTLEITSSDRFGVSARREIVVTSRNAALDWDNVTLDAIRATSTPPPVAVRNLALMSVAMSDVVQTLNPHYATFLPSNTLPALPQSVAGAAAANATQETREAWTVAALNSAAQEILKSAFPTFTARFDALSQTTLAELPDTAAVRDAAAWGRAVAQILWSARSHDVADVATLPPYVPGTAPGEWRPTAPGFAPGLLPYWGETDAFVIPDVTAYRPGAAPALSSAEYATAWDQVKSLGSATSTQRTADQTDIAKFWADGGGTATPPGHWNRIAAGLAWDGNFSLSETTRMLAVLNLAMSDAGVAAWDTKYAYEFWRPIDAIRQADQDGNPATTADPAWTPLLVTPPFPSYTSGHSTFSGAAAAALAGIFGTDNVSFTSTTEAPGIAPRTFTSFSQAAAEAGMSRIYGGIHYLFDDTAGRAAGNAIGSYVVSHVIQPK